MRDHPILAMRDQPVPEIDVTRPALPKRDIAPEGYMERLEEAMKAAPKLLPQDTANDPPTLVLADPDGWIPWHGGECPVPLGVMVLTKLSNGNTLRKPVRCTGSKGWRDGTIVAYKVMS